MRPKTWWVWWWRPPKWSRVDDKWGMAPPGTSKRTAQQEIAAAKCGGYETRGPEPYDPGKNG